MLPSSKRYSLCAASLTATLSEDPACPPSMENETGAKGSAGCWGMPVTARFCALRPVPLTKASLSAYTLPCALKTVNWQTPVCSLSPSNVAVRLPPVPSSLKSSMMPWFITVRPKGSDAAEPEAEACRETLPPSCTILRATPSVSTSGRLASALLEFHVNRALYFSPVLGVSSMVPRPLCSVDASATFAPERSVTTRLPSRCKPSSLLASKAMRLGTPAIRCPPSGKNVTLPSSGALSALYCLRKGRSVMSWYSWLGSVGLSYTGKTRL